MADSHPIDRARLTEHAAAAPPVHRYPPAPGLAALVRHYWVPVWDLCEGQDITEQVLQYPTCLIVVAHDYARFYGVARGLSTVTLSGRGSAVGVMLQPGAGRAIAEREVGDLVDTYADLASFPRLAGLTGRVRGAMSPAPSDSERHHAAILEIERALGQVRPLDDEEQLLNRVVAEVESDRELMTVTALVARVGITERTLQRLTGRLLGLTPKWLIQRRRLHEAAHELKGGTQTLAGLAADLGYVDQAHFTRDFRRITGYTPAAFARDLGRDSPRT